MKKIDISEKALKELLETMTVSEVASYFNVSRSTVERRMKEYGIAPKVHYRQPDVSHILTREYLESVKDTHTYKDVMRETGLKKSTVNKYLNKYGIKLKVDTYSGERSHRWKGGSFIRSSKTGTQYRFVAAHRDDDGKLHYKREHVLVMEEHIGRELLPNEVVHHVDGDGLNNNLDNLVLMTNDQHNKFHFILAYFEIDYKKLTKKQVLKLIDSGTKDAIRTFIEETIQDENLC